MPQTAEVVVVGAGIVGASIAWHLTRRGCREVLLVEREMHQGLGSTGKSMGGVRAQFATDVNIRMSLYSIPFFARFEEEVGHPSGYQAHGYLFMATSDQHVAYLRRNMARQRELGLTNVEWLTAGDIARAVPFVRVDDVRGGTFCPTDGFVDPHLVMTGFTQGALAGGATLWKGVTVERITTEGGRVTGVDTTRGHVSAPVVVTAAGPWAAALAETAGADLPVTPLRRMLVPTEPFPGLPERLPMVIDMSTGFHFRPEARGLLLAWNDPAEQPGVHTGVRPGFIEQILTRAVERVPAFADLEVNPRRAWAGLYEMSPDHHGILGPAHGVTGLFHANGFSGHGVMHSPASGRIVADLIVDGRSEAVDWQPMAADRFARGAVLHETAVL